MLARRIFADGRTRAYAWGRSAAREDVAAAAESLLAMSGQFEQRRLARPAYQRGVLDAFAGRRHPGGAAAPGASCRPRGARYDELTQRRRRGRGAARRSCARSPRTPTGLEPAREDELRGDRERLRHVTELAQAAAGAAARARARRRRAARPTSSRPPSARSRRSSGSRPSSRRPATRCAQAELQLRETASELRASSRRSRPSPGGSSRSRPSSTGSPT